MLVEEPSEVEETKFVEKLVLVEKLVPVDKSKFVEKSVLVWEPEIVNRDVKEIAIRWLIMIDCNCNYYL